MGWFPRFVGTMSHYDFLGAFSPHFVAFMRRYLGTSEFRPRSASDAGPADHPGVCGTGCSRPVSFEEPSGSPKFPGNPLDHSPCSPTPAGSSTRCGTRGQRTRHGPRLKPGRGRPTTCEVFGAQSHGVWSGCLRLVVAVSRPCTQDSLPAAGPSSAGRDSNPQSSYERFPSVANPSSFPELPWREVCFVKPSFLASPVRMNTNSDRKTIRRRSRSDAGLRSDQRIV